VLELFGASTSATDDALAWGRLIRDQQCPFLGRKCVKVRKSEPDVAIGTCTVAYGSKRLPVMICPHRLIHGRKVFVDCLHLLTLHEPGNELHIVPEISIPGGSVDYFLVSARNSRVRDFVGIELQTLDTTGTVWPERQRFLKTLGIASTSENIKTDKHFGMNWKMTAKTTLVQLHHKIETFEHLNKHMVLVIQDYFLEYMRRTFSFAHFSNPPRVGDFLHIHGYGLATDGNELRLDLAERLSTDSSGVARALGRQVTARIELESIVSTIEAKLSLTTRFTPV
jgi:Restriction endonuclease NotI